MVKNSTNISLLLSYLSYIFGKLRKNRPHFYILFKRKMIERLKQRFDLICSVHAKKQFANFSSSYATFFAKKTGTKTMNYNTVKRYRLVCDPITMFV